MSILACFCEDLIQCVPYWRGFANKLFDASCHPSVLACVCEQITPCVVSYFASACVCEQNIRYITCASTVSLYNNVLLSASPRAFANKLLRSIRQVSCAWRKIHSTRPVALPFGIHCKQWTLIPKSSKPRFVASKVLIWVFYRLWSLSSWHGKGSWIKPNETPRDQSLRKWWRQRRVFCLQSHAEMKNWQDAALNSCLQTDADEKGRQDTGRAE